MPVVKVSMVVAAAAATLSGNNKTKCAKKKKKSHRLFLMHFVHFNTESWYDMTSILNVWFYKLLAWMSSPRRRSDSLFYLQNISEKAPTSKCHLGKRYHQLCFFSPSSPSDFFLSAEATEPSQKCWCWDIWEGAERSCDPLIPSFPSASLLVGFHLLVALWGKT